MKVKQEKQVRLDELISYIWKNEITSTVFQSCKGKEINVGLTGTISHDPVYYFNKEDLFTITEEVDIEYDTRLDLIAVRKAGTVSRFENRSIQGVLTHFNIRLEVEVDYIYFQNEDGSIGDLIWSKERGLI